MPQWRPTISRMVFTSPPSLRMAYKRLAKFNFKDSYMHQWRPTFQMVFTSPPSTRVAYHASGGWQLEDGLTGPPPWEWLTCSGKDRRQSQGWSPQAHLPEDSLHAPTEADNFRMVFTSPPSMTWPATWLRRATSRGVWFAGTHQPGKTAIFRGR